LRWLVFTGQALLITVEAGLGLWGLPTAALLGIVGLGCLSNAALYAWQRAGPARRAPLGEAALAGTVALDVALFTALLMLAGGAYNPFSGLYLFYVAVAAMALRPAWTWAIVGASVAGYSALFAVEIMPPGDHSQHLRLHLLGMWFAYVITGPFLALGVTRIRAQLARAREERQRGERLASLATLAAGAAHELSTPLGTIAVAAREMERRAAGDLRLADDTRLIRLEVDRCRRILQQLAADVGAPGGEAPVAVTVGELIDASLERLGPAEELAVTVPADLEERLVFLPARQVSLALRGLVKNALQAGDGAPARLSARALEGRLTFEVLDRGPGLPPEVVARAGEPFFTTKPPGEGMGLGLFFARAVAERAGGGLELAPALGGGARATLWVPLREGAGPDG